MAEPGRYAPPAQTSNVRPMTIALFRVHASVVTVVYLVTAALIVSASPLLSMGLAAVALLHAVAAAVPLRPWAWTLGLVVLAIGLTGPTFVPAVVLLLRWRTPIVKAAFGRPPI